MPTIRKPTAAEAPRRGRGRPPKDAHPEVSRERIAAIAIELSKTLPLSEITMVRLAQELGVTHGLLHYYVKGRGELASLVLNHLYAELFVGIESVEGDWRRQLETIAQRQREVLTTYAGATMHVAVHNRHRILQDVHDSEADFGLLFTDRLFQIMRDVGFGKRDGVMAAHLLSNFVLFSSLSEVTRSLPKFHEEYLTERLAALDRDSYPGMHWAAAALPRIGADEVFASGLRYLLDGFEATLERR
jgi:AcrR family transcriptional regulator